MLSTMFERISSRPLGLTRIVVGVAALIRAGITWSLLDDLIRPETLKAPVTGWLPQPTLAVAMAVVAIWMVAGILFMIGWRVPISGTLLSAVIAVTLVLDQQLYANHLYLMVWIVLLLTLADSGAGLNVHREDRQVTRWPVLLLMLQVSIVYGFSALTKVNSEYLSGALLGGTLGTGLVPFPDSLRTTAFLSVVAALTIVVEIFIALFIWRSRFRPLAFLLGLALHLSILLFMTGTLQLLVFALEMLAVYPLFLSDEKLTVVWDDKCDWCRKWVQWFRRLDLLRSLRIVGKSSADNPFPVEEVDTSMHLIHHGRTSKGFAAVTRILEHLVPTLWVAPLVRLPIVRHAGERLYRWQAARRSCSMPDPLKQGSSKAR